MLFIPLVIVLVMIGLQVGLKKIVSKERLQVYTAADVKAVQKKDYSLLRRRLVVGYLGLSVVLPLLVSVLFMRLATSTDRLAQSLRSLLASDALFFNGSPAVLVLAFLGGVVVLMGGWLIFRSAAVFLPTDLQAYLGLITRSNMPALHPAPSRMLITRLALGIVVAGVVGMVAMLPLFVAVSREYVYAIHRYPAHKRLALHDVHLVQVVCTATGKDIWVDMIARSAKGDVVLVAPSSGTLPIAPLSNEDIRRLFETIEGRDIPIISATNPTCDRAAAQNPAARAQYDLFFKK